MSPNQGPKKPSAMKQKYEKIVYINNLRKKTSNFHEFPWNSNDTCFLMEGFEFSQPTRNRVPFTVFQVCCHDASARMVRPMQKSKDFNDRTNFTTLGFFDGQIPVGVLTPWKINIEHNHGGLEDHFPF